MNTNIMYAIGGVVVGVLGMGAFSYIMPHGSDLRGCGSEHMTQYNRETDSMHMMHGDRVMQDSDSAQSMGMMNGTSTMDMSGIMHGMMMGLQGQTGDAFDRTFLSGMIVHHQGAVTMAQAVLQKSKRPELIKLAQDIISAQTTEINQMQTWQKNWFPVGK